MHSTVLGDPQPSTKGKRTSRPGGIVPIGPFFRTLKNAFEESPSKTKLTFLAGPREVLFNTSSHRGLVFIGPWLLDLYTGRSCTSTLGQTPSYGSKSFSCGVSFFACSAFCWNWLAERLRKLLICPMRSLSSAYLRIRAWLYSLLR